MVVLSTEESFSVVYVIMGYSPGPQSSVWQTRIRLPYHTHAIRTLKTSKMESFETTGNDF